MRLDSEIGFIKWNFEIGNFKVGLKVGLSWCLFEKSLNEAEKSPTLQGYNSEGEIKQNLFFTNKVISTFVKRGNCGRI